MRFSSPCCACPVCSLHGRRENVARHPVCFCADRNSSYAVNVRHVESNDFDLVSAVIDAWWGSRPVRASLHRLFFEHFQNTSFVLTEKQALAGFLIGFRSQSSPSMSYVHFLGIRPELRAKGYGRFLYECFFSVVAEMGCTEVRAITSPANESSIRFHLRLGFQCLPGNGEVNGFPVSMDHGGPGQHRVLFAKPLRFSDDTWGALGEIRDE